MKNMFKRCIAIILVVIMLLGSAPLETLTVIDFGEIFDVKAEAATLSDKGHTITDVNSNECVEITTNNGWNTELCIFGWYPYRTEVTIELDRWSEAFMYLAKYTKLEQITVGHTAIHQCGLCISIYDSNNNLYKKYVTQFINTTEKMTIDEIELPGRNKEYRFEFSLVNLDPNNPCEDSVAKAYLEMSNYFSGLRVKINYGSINGIVETQIAKKNAANYVYTGGEEYVNPIQTTNLYFSNLNYSVENSKISATIKNKESKTISSYGIYINNISNFNNNNIMWRSSSATSQKSIEVSQKIDGLTPNTKYYYSIFAKTSDGLFLSNPQSFKTPLIKPPKAKISSAKAIDYRNNTETNSTDMGVGDNVSIKWNKADYADYYTISINGVEDKTKIKGTSKVLSFDEAGTKTIKVRAHNSVGSGEWSDAVKVTVHPDVNITFYKDGNIYQSQTLTWGHDFETLPEIPVKKGAAFKGWFNEEGTTAASFKNIRNDLDVYATYNINKYTVQFVGPDGTPIGEPQIVEYEKPAIAPDEETVKKDHVKEGRVFIGWNKDFSRIVENTTIMAVTDAENQEIPVEVTDVKAERYKKNYIVTCNVNNLTRADVENGRIVVALTTAEGKLVTTTESAAFFIDGNYTDKNGNVVRNSEYIKVIVPIRKGNETYNATYAKVYVINDYMSLVPISSVVEKVRVVENEIWSDDTLEDKTEGMDENDWDSWLEYRSKEYLITSTTSAAERDRLENEGWDLDETATKTHKDKNSGTWTTKKPTSGKVDVDYAETTVTDKEATTVYKYKTYKYWHKANGAYYYSYGRGYADDMGYKGEWLYLETGSALKKIGDADGYYQYDNSNDNHIWYSNGTNKKTDPKVPVDAVTHKEYRVFDTVYTYYLNKWSDWSEWTREPITETGTIDVDEPRRVFIYKVNEPVEREEDTTGEFRADGFLIDCNEAYANKQLILAIYKINEASDWTLEHIDQTVADENGMYEFAPYKLREEPSATTGDYTVVLGVEGSEKPIYIDTIEAPKPEYTVTYVDSTTGKKIPISSEEVENYKYYYKRYRYEYNGTYRITYSTSAALSGATNGTWQYYVTTEPLECTGSNDGVAVYEGWYRADSNKTEGIKYTVYKEYVGTSTVYTYEQKVVEHGDAIPPEAPVHEGYTFSHWDMRSSDIIGETVINAVYTPNEYTVVWIDYVQEKYEVETYKHGQNLVQPYGLTDTDEMISTGWDSYVSGTVVPVTSNMVITAQYEYKTFTVDFFDFDGNVVDSQTVKYGETPEIPEFDYYSEDYIFFGFTSEEEYAIEDEELLETASVELTDGSASEEGVAAEGEHSDYIMVESYEIYNNCQIVPKFEYTETTETPTIDVKTGTYATARTVTIDCATENASIFYTLDGSDPATSETTIESSVPATITISDSCQLRYYASAFNMNASAEGSEWYAINDGSETYKYIVRFAAYDDSNVVYTGIVEKGSLIDEELISEVDGYTFSGAYKNINVETDSETGEMTNVTYSDKWNFATDTVTANTTLYLDYAINSYTVEFVDFDGMILDTQTVEYENSATVPEVPSREGYVFTGWDTDEFVAVTENLTVNAVYVPEDEYVTIDLNRSNYTMMSGNSYTLTATTGGNVENPEIIWASSDENVVVVDDNGVVTATGKGSAEIYAIVIDNGETATCKINVVGNPSDELTLVGKSHLAVDDYGYIRGFTVSTDAETQEHYAETVSEVKSQFLNNELVFTDINGNILSDDDSVGTGTVIKLMNGDEVLDEITVVVSGDMDGDGYVTNRDASRISRYLVDKESPTEVQICAMDVNGDGYVNNRDASVVSRYLVGKEAI